MCFRIILTQASLKINFFASGGVAVQQSRLVWLGVFYGFSTFDFAINSPRFPLKVLGCQSLLWPTLRPLLANTSAFLGNFIEWASNHKWKLKRNFLLVTSSIVKKRGRITQGEKTQQKWGLRSNGWTAVICANSAFTGFFSSTRISLTVSVYILNCEYQIRIIST